MTDTSAHGSSTNKIVSNLLISYAAQVLTMVLSLVPIVLLPRYVGAVGMGRLSIASSLNSVFVAVILMGTTSYVVREIARDQEGLSEILSSAVVLRVGLCVLLSPVLLVTLFVLGYPQETQLVALIIYGVYALRAVSYAFAEAIQALERMRWRSGGDVAREIVVVVIGWVVFLQGGGVLGYALTLALAELVQFMVHLGFFLLVVPVRPVLRWRVIKQTFRGGLPFFLWAFLQTMYASSATLMLSKLGGDEATGWYGGAMQFVVPLFMIPSVGITVLLPRFSQLHVLGPARLRAAVSHAVNYMMIVTMPAAFGLAVIAGRLIDLFQYPATFQHSVPVLQVLAFILPGTSVLMVLATGVAAANKERAWGWVSLFSLALAVAFAGILIPLAGRLTGNPAVGAAAAVLVTELCTLGFVLRIFGRTTVDRSTFVTFWKTSLAASVMAAVVLAAAGLPLPLAIGLGVVVYTILVLKLNVITPEDIYSVQGIVIGRLRRIALALR